MKALPLYDEAVLSDALKRQQRLAFNLEKSIKWRRGIDIKKPLVPLDRFNIVFPRLTNAKQKLALSQFMGLVMAATFSETEKALGRLRKDAWHDLMQNYAVNPEMIALGEQFFAEEEKHSLAFDRYIDLFAHEIGVNPHELKNLLPTVGSGLIERWFRHNARKDGLLLWWVVATVEEESVMIFRQMIPFRNELDPLYYELHKKHFEEEARHAPYAFMILDMCLKQNKVLGRRLSLDFIRSELVKIIWMVIELAKVRGVAKLRDRHQFFSSLDDLLKTIRLKDIPALAYRMLVSTPYLSPFINAGYHPELNRTLKNHHVLRLPMPRPNPEPLEWR